MPILLFSLPFFLLSFVARLGLLVYALSKDQLTATTAMVSKIFVLGIVNDSITLLYCITPFAIAALVTPLWLKRQKFFHIFSALLYFGWIFALCFSAAGEYLFWEEFQARYNFIAVDYLIYTQEVTDNITESYPIVAIIAGLLAISTIIFITFFPILKHAWNQQRGFRANTLPVITIITIMLLPLYLVTARTTEITVNRYANELSKNGIYSLFAAFKNNKLDYSRFYQTLPEEKAFKRLRSLVKADNETYVSDNLYDLSRVVSPEGTPKQYNVILLSVESLSAEFLGQFGEDKTITPYLNKLVPDTLNFTRYFAAGTRTVRGLESMTLSVPPTPGNSILRRPKNEGLFSIGTVFKEQGYDTKFLYGGYGYFDNMNYFFSNNDFAIVDRSDIDNVSFSNAWGVADGDLFSQTIKEADKSFAAGKPFFSLVMTTSNHRPYTYPEGKIDIPSGTGRKGAVKYTDYAIGQLLEQAKTKPWFDNTIFIITADHCASSAGKTEIPVHKYHIPLMIYAPKIIKPSSVDTLTSQMDLAPTIAGLLNFHYTSKFFGTDILRNPRERAMLGTYQKLGYLTTDKLTILDVEKQISMFSWNQNEELSEIPLQEDIIKDTISYYQGADYLFSHGWMKR